MHFPLGGNFLSTDITEVVLFPQPFLVKGPYFTHPFESLWPETQDSASLTGRIVGSCFLGLGCFLLRLFKSLLPRPQSPSPLTTKTLFLSLCCSETFKHSSAPQDNTQMFQPSRQGLVDPASQTSRRLPSHS